MTKHATKITGYKKLTQQQIDTMNKCKEIGVTIGDLISEISEDNNTDQRWLAIGKIDMQKGLMSVIRSIAQPNTF